jgi:selT/selW/selH-like putative selenoprotein
LAAAIRKSAALVRGAGGAGSAGVEIELVGGRRGSFEVTKDGVLVFSKLDQGRFPSSDDEVIRAL